MQGRVLGGFGARKLGWRAWTTRRSRGMRRVPSCRQPSRRSASRRWRRHCPNACQRRLCSRLWSAVPGRPCQAEYGHQDHRFLGLLVPLTLRLGQTNERRAQPCLSTRFGEVARKQSVCRSRPLRLDTWSRSTTKIWDRASYPTTRPGHTVDDRGYDSAYSRELKFGLASRPGLPGSTQRPSARPLGLSPLGGGSACRALRDESNPRTRGASAP